MAKLKFCFVNFLLGTSSKKKGGTIYGSLFKFVCSQDAAASVYLWLLPVQRRLLTAELIRKAVMRTVRLL